jgi:hypothetical protein
MLPITSVPDDEAVTVSEKAVYSMAYGLEKIHYIKAL